MALLGHGEEIPASFRSACSAGPAGAKHSIVVCCNVRALSIASIHSRCPTWPVHQLSSVFLRSRIAQGAGRGPWQGLRPGGLRGSTGCILFPKLQQPAPGLRIRRGGGGDAMTSPALCGFFPVRGGLLRCFGLAIGDNGLMRVLKLDAFQIGQICQETREPRE
ncbi:hypothetical protein LI328DRAFT_168587 [Trichoderma asperelloides]|nr:hypothetical protein LI328DRAFT_168587 [Trichoderma asperelloides]